ncbi:MAG: hypothetical protein HYX57_11075 [Chloroflexi bacterium]|nr:hypothetical protein [Chloroflexota bacterium]
MTTAARWRGWAEERHGEPCPARDYARPRLVFQPLEVVPVGAAVGISALIALDGESNWREGALLTIGYVILAVSFFEFGRPVG